MRFIWVWPALLLLFVIWAFIKYDYTSAAIAFSRTDWRMIVIAFLFNISLLYFRVFKWRFFFESYKNVSYYNLSLAAFVGYLCNMVIPARVGGIVQAWLLGKKENIDASTVFGSVVLIRIIDGIMLVVLALFILFMIETPAADNSIWVSILRTVVVVGLSLLSVIFLTLVFLKKRSITNKLTNGIIFFVPSRFKEKVTTSIEMFLKGSEILNTPRRLGLVLFLSLTFWILCGLLIFIHLKAFGLGALGITASFFILLAQVFSMSIPALANVGPYHASTVTVLSMYSVHIQSGIYIAIVMHGVMFVSSTLPGLIYLWYDKMNIGSIVHGIKDAK